MGADSAERGEGRAEVRQSQVRLREAEESAHGDVGVVEALNRREAGTRALLLSGFKIETVSDISYFVLKPGNMNVPWLNLLLSTLRRRNAAGMMSCRGELRIILQSRARSSGSSPATLAADCAWNGIESVRGHECGRN